MQKKYEKKTDKEITPFCLIHLKLTSSKGTLYKSKNNNDRARCYLMSSRILIFTFEDLVSLVLILKIWCYLFFLLHLYLKVNGVLRTSLEKLKIAIYELFYLCPFPLCQLPITRNIFYLGSSLATNDLDSGR